MRSHILSTASLQKALGNSTPGTYKKKRRSSRKSDSATNVTKTDQPTSQWYTTTEISQSSTSITSLISNLHTTPIFELRQEVNIPYIVILEYFLRTSSFKRFTQNFNNFYHFKYIFAFILSQLTPKRPLRSEVEKERRMSNRWSGQSQHYLRNANNGLDSGSLGKGNRDSVGTTDSTASEDDPPPPLPIKTREADYCNLPEELSSSHHRCMTSGLNNLNRSLEQWTKTKLPTPTDELDDHTKPPTPPPKPKRPVHSLNKIVLSSNDVDNLHEDSSTA